MQLEKSVKAEGSVEVWLNQLLQRAQSSLHGTISEASKVVAEPNSHQRFLELVETLPAQVGILAVQMIWTRDSEAALVQARQDRKVMHDANNKFLELLNQLIDQTTKNLTKIQRIKYETLVTIHVHQRDIFDAMVVCFSLIFYG